VTAPDFVRRAALSGVLALILTPATALGATGGASVDALADPPAATVVATASDEAVAPATTDEDPTSHGPTTAELPGAGRWRAAPTTVAGKPVIIRGDFDVAHADRRVIVERRTPSGRWTKATSARVRSTGRFVARWKTRSKRYHQLRVVLGGAAPRATGEHLASPSVDDGDPGTVRVVVLDSGRATWYGPGFYGRRTACGQTLTARTVGVAHRSLPCGTQVEIRRGGRTVVAPVIDRGPFANGAVLDLTKNLADDLGVTGVQRVRYLPRTDLRRAASPTR